MSFAEAAIVIIDGRSAFDWTPRGRTAGFLPDGREFWEFLAEHRDELEGVAHLHPGDGWPVASAEDVTTFDAVERGLGQRLDWWIISSDSGVLYRREGAGYGIERGWSGWPVPAFQTRHPEAMPPRWVAHLRSLGHVNINTEERT